MSLSGFTIVWSLKTGFTEQDSGENSNQALDYNIPYLDVLQYQFLSYLSEVLSIFEDFPENNQTAITLFLPLTTTLQIFVQKKLPIAMIYLKSEKKKKKKMEYNFYF